MFVKMCLIWAETIAFDAEIPDVSENFINKHKNTKIRSVGALEKPE